MHVIISSNLIWTEGINIVYGLGVFGLLGFFFWRPAFWTSVGLLLFSFYFFRNPERVCPQAITDNSVLICPADGMVVDIQYDKNNGLLGYAQRVSIFLSPVDVHVQWAPMEGTVDQIKYTAGQFTFAFLPKSSDLNEHNDVVISNTNNQKIMLRQIAGTIARRICCWTHEGQLLQAGQKYGMIRFGSRVDIFLPSSVILAVGVGQKVLGGQTILGRWHNGISHSQEMAQN